VKRYMIGATAAVLTAGGLITVAPTASAGCQYGGGVESRCDGPVQPDGTWQRCVTTHSFYDTRPGSPSNIYLNRNCQLMGPDQHPLGLAFADPPTHIDD
jgi:hypothetical protein